MLKSLIFTICILSPVIANAETVEIDGVRYKLVEKVQEAEVVKRLSVGYSGDIVIPSSISYQSVTYSVTSISDNAFDGCSGLTSVTVGNNVKSIGNRAFHNCCSLTSVTIGIGVTSIGDYAFFDCSSLASVCISDVSAWCNIKFGSGPMSYSHLFVNGKEIETLEIPNGVTYIPDYAFNGCSCLTSVSIPNSVSSIGKCAFQDCSGLVSVSIPNSVSSIGEGAFEGCSGLISVLIGNGVTSIGKRAFRGCSGLTSVSVPSSVTEIGSEAFLTTLRKYDEETGEPIFYSPISVHVSDISAWCSINIGNAFIGHHLYENGEEVKDLIIPDNVVSIGSYAFYGCSSLNSVTIPNSVNSIGKWAFAGCSNLNSVIIGNSVASIGDYAFSGSLTSVRISDLSTWCNINFAVGSNPLKYAKHLFVNEEEIKELVIPPNVTTIGKSAFEGFSGLLSVDIGESVTSIGVSAFSGCTGLTSVKIGNNVTSIGGSAFSGCTGLTSVKIGNNVTSIGGHAFRDCTGLTSVNISNSVMTIGDFAFYRCSNISNILLGKGVKKIGSCAFCNCKNLINVICLAKSIPSTNTNIFNNSDVEYATLYVYELLIEDYKGRIPWNSFKSIVAADIPMYTLTYIVDGEIYKSMKYEEGERITPEETPQKEGYTFSGWNEIPEEMPANDVTIIGSFTKIPLGKCATPTINILKGYVVFACETEGVSYHYEIKHLGEKSGEGNNIQLTNNYIISVFASREGYDNSDLTTRVFECSCEEHMIGDLNVDGAINAADIVKLVDIIMKEEKQ